VFSLAFLAGVLAAFNPCGFVLLPAYLASIIVGENDPEPGWKTHIRALKFSAGMTLGFIGVFGGFALLLSSVSGSIMPYLPYVTVAVGVILILISLSLILGQTLILRKLANPNIAPTRGWLSQIGYGLSFALASLSCTIGPFLAITAAAIANGNIFSTFTLFAVYAIGMGSVVLLLALSVSTARIGLITKLKKSQGKISKFSGYFLLLVGLYQSWYGVYEIRILRGDNSSDPIISFAISIQSKITQSIANLGTGNIILSVALITSVLLFLGTRKRRIENVHSDN
jgi:cytochrome c biogenesis protein CcdA